MAVAVSGCGGGSNGFTDGAIDGIVGDGSNPDGNANPDGRGDGSLADRGDVGSMDGNLDATMDGSRDGSRDATLDGADSSAEAGDGSNPDGCTPTGAETCNGIDDDCNGQTDEGLGSTTCGTGECARTVQNCVNGHSNSCTPGTASMEVCDGLDNDCNGQTDEGLGTATCGQGACARTVDNCANGVVQSCVPGPRASEICNGIDDNCDGSTDEGFGSVSCGQGTCAQTIQSCVNGMPQTCTPLPPQPEACDGLDNNCDGTVDEGLGSTTCGVGACRRTTQNCVGGSVQTCVAGTPGAEICNGQDDDCDGMTDEDLGLITCGVGACTRQVAACTNGVMGICIPGTASGEVCDGVDNNCDGQTDEGDPGGGASCGTGQPGICAAGTRHCFGGSLQCLANFNGMDAEQCNGLDDNCNGIADEGLGSTTCGVGACQRTIQNCQSGMVQTCVAGNPTTETCNGIDDDCNGQTDEGLGSTSCGIGACRNTVQNCVNGRTQTCAAGSPTTEACNGLDDDCNGMTDDGLGSTSCGLGACTRTQQNCVNGVQRACVPGATTPEVCDNIDNDCNGQTDEGVQTTFFRDADGDGFGNPAATTQACAPPPGYVADSSDCNDAAASVHPGATETCNLVDDNCNGQVDEGVKSTFYRDADADNFGDVNAPIQACTMPAGYVANSTDCDDTATSVHPGATETCNLVDDNCNGRTDEGVQNTYYRDSDRDNFGDPASSTLACTPPSGYVTSNTDCNDANAAVHPGAAELCNGVDDNCNGQTDEGVQSTFYQDSDSDTFGNLAVTTQACTAPAGYVVNSTDCNDTDATVHPGATETCNGVDDNCNGTVDEGVKSTFYQDNDRDGFGNPAISTQACTAPAGYVSDNTDCNDTVAAVHPGATETCNGRDDNCDGQIDEGVKNTYYRDVDGDGYGNNAQTQQACTAPTGYVTDNTDCNDTAASVHPGATETCNGVDDNCDGTTDEGVKNTYYQDSDRDGFGNSAQTQQACTAPAGYVSDNTDCNDTVASVHPGATETCNGVDDNCNGTVDEGNPGGGANCSTGQQGICSAGTTACTAGAIVCNRTNAPRAETCNGLDDDCNGVTDNGNPGGGVSCSTGQQGVCSAGTTACTAGAVVCNRNTNPTAETCNGLDDDCNGVTDNGNPGGGVSCSTGQQGICSAGTTACTAGAIACNRNSAPTAETCNGLDDDCNGVTDNGNPGGGVACSTGQLGVCSAGTTACTAGAIACNRNTAPSAETCDGADNNCNGMTDEGVTQACYTGPAGTNNVGTCHGGTQTCSNGTFGACVGQALPTAEACDNQDNNCNGQVDDGNPGGGANCSTGQLGVCSAGTTACTAGAVVCNRNTAPGTESCNGLDDNCNGATDEGNPGGGASCSTGQLGVCSAGTTACTAGAVVCNRNNAPSTETCDGADNNCNGTTDEGNPGGGVACNTGMAGICGPGTTACTAGAVVCNRNAAPGTETCNGLDDNCNGMTDEGVQTRYYRDLDGDGFGSAASSVTACSQPAGYVVNSTDCNDGNSGIHPGAPEVCNGVDDNCSGTTDEGNPGGGVSCNTGMPGICAPGTTACTGGAVVCNRNQNPSGEVCNGLDDDCNGVVDNGNPGGGVACNTGMAGICAPGTTACTSGTVVCNRNNNPATETCNGADDNCNGQVDENALPADGYPNTCANAGSKTVSVAAGGATQNVTGYVDNTADDFFVVNFSGVGAPGTYYHPVITSNSAAFTFTVLSACGTPYSACSTNITAFTMAYPANPNSCQSFADCTDATPKTTQFIVQVHRASGAPFFCGSYTISISNQ